MEDFRYKDYFNEEFADFENLKELHEHAQDHFTAVIEMLYVDGELDIFKLEYHLSEVGCALGVKLPKHQPTVARVSSMFDIACNIVRQHAMLV